MSVAAPGDGQVQPGSLQRRFAAELLGTAFLLIAVVGSGIAAERLAAGDAALAVLANALATGAALFALIGFLGPVSGAHFNPAVTLALLSRRDINGRSAAAYVLAQLLGAVLGVGCADAMFGVPVYSWSGTARSGLAELLGEFVATFGLVGVVWICTRLCPSSLAGIVAAYIFAAFWFTPADFANPAITVARALTETFSGIRPADVPGFVVAELGGAAAAVAVFRWLVPDAYTAAGRAESG
jgi:glycerol uptake facilitator-like aquaporin